MYSTALYTVMKEPQTVKFTTVFESVSDIHKYNLTSVEENEFKLLDSGQEVIRQNL